MFGHSHFPLVQTCVGPHAVAQSPQWLLSVCVSMQVEPQAT